MDSTVVPRKPTISPGKTVPLASTTSHNSPTEQNGPSDSTSEPISWVTRPCQRKLEQAAKRLKYGASKTGVLICLLAAWPADRLVPAQSHATDFPRPTGSCPARFAVRNDRLRPQDLPPPQEHFVIPGAGQSSRGILKLAGDALAPRLGWRSPFSPE